MVDDRYFLLEEDFLTAEANGIGRRNAVQRVEYFGWSVERAITEPVRRGKSAFQKEWEAWEDIATQNGVTRDNFYNRTAMQKWSSEDAATKPVRRRWTEKQLEAMSAKGVYPSLIYTRVHKLGWTEEEAMNTPVLTAEQKAERIAAGTRNYHANNKKETKWGNRL